MKFEEERSKSTIIHVSPFNSEKKASWSCSDCERFRSSRSLERSR
uniref:Uncharacterized protein n=1 Tax=Arundo donax TaxID=35708 RepID=A0A0A9AQC6_ARUDO